MIVTQGSGGIPRIGDPRECVLRSKSGVGAITIKYPEKGYYMNALWETLLRGPGVNIGLTSGKRTLRNNP